MRPSRPISWIKAAYKSFLTFPADVREEVLSALDIAAQGEMADTAKPLHGLGSGVIELAIRHRGDAWRVVYALRVGTEIWVVHAFQKKSTSGIATPKHEIDLVAAHMKRLKEMLR